MFCDGCGTALQPGQSFCSGCGKQIMAGMQTHVREDRVRQHIRLLGILWLAMSAMNAVGGVAVIIVAHTLFGPRGISGPPLFLQPLLTFVGILILAKAAIGFFSGWGLLRRQPWARMLTIVLAILSLFNIPFGTALGVYSLWVLLPAESERQYEVLARAESHA